MSVCVVCLTVLVFVECVSYLCVLGNCFIFETYCLISFYYVCDAVYVGVTLTCKHMLSNILWYANAETIL